MSRVINGRSGVAPETVIAVRRAMKEVGYTPSARRPGPKPSDRNGVSTGNVGLLMIGTDAMFARAPVTAAVFHAVEQSLAEKGFNLIVGQVDDAGRLPPYVARGQIDGLLLHGYAPSAAVRRTLERHPSVWLLSQRSARGYWGDRVCPDNELIGRTAAEYLVAERGYRRVAYLYFSATHSGFRQRAEAFVDTAADYGAEAQVIPDENLTMVARLRRSAEIGEDETDQMVEMLLSQNPMPEAVFVPRDRLVVKVYRALRRRGIEPGRDLEIMSCDDEPILDALDPRPTTIDVRPDLIGRQAVDIYTSGRS
ncbi:MAG: LacI family DNA-binding transcriptional regulator, partial [Planctomycetota bacterium]